MAFLVAGRTRGSKRKLDSIQNRVIQYNIVEHSKISKTKLGSYLKMSRRRLLLQALTALMYLSGSFIKRGALVKTLNSEDAHERTTNSSMETAE